MVDIHADKEVKARRKQRPAADTRETSTEHDDFLQLQSKIGNHALQRLIAQRKIQPKLTVGASDDGYEQEADRVAREVMAMPLQRTDLAEEADEDLLSRKPIQRADLTNEKDEEAIFSQTQSDGGVPGMMENAKSPHRDEEQPWFDPLLSEPLLNLKSPNPFMLYYFKKCQAVRKWFDANTFALIIHQYTLPALIRQARKNVPEAEGLEDIFIQDEAEHWAQRNNYVIPAQSMALLTPSTATIVLTIPPKKEENGYSEVVSTETEIPINEKLKFTLTTNGAKTEVGAELKLTEHQLKIVDALGGTLKLKLTSKIIGQIDAATLEAQAHLKASAALEFELRDLPITIAGGMSGKMVIGKEAEKPKPELNGLSIEWRF
jgi:hypothetical protein